jgi:hypothetical protein
MRRERAMQGGRLTCGVGLLRMVGILLPFGLQDRWVKRRKLPLWVELPWKIKYLETLMSKHGNLIIDVVFGG